MKPQCTKNQCDQTEVDVEEGLIERMSKGGERGDEDSEKADPGDETPHDEGSCVQGTLEDIVSGHVSHLGAVGHADELTGGVNNRQSNHHTTVPTVERVESVERDVEQLDQRIVAPTDENKDEHVADGE